MIVDFVSTWKLLREDDISYVKIKDMISQIVKAAGAWSKAKQAEDLEQIGLQISKLDADVDQALPTKMSLTRQSKLFDFQTL